MSKKKKLKTKRPPFQAAPSLSASVDDADGLERPVVAVTVAWSLTFVCTAGALILAWVMLWKASATPRVQGIPNMFGVMGNLLLLVAAITGAIGILLTPLVYRIRRIPPPPTFTISVLLVGSIPWLVLFMRYLGYSD